MMSRAVLQGLQIVGAQPGVEMVAMAAVDAHMLPVTVDDGGYHKHVFVVLRHVLMVLCSLHTRCEFLA